MEEGGRGRRERLIASGDVLREKGEEEERERMRAVRRERGGV